ncbi:MAG: M48 family metallopeptidase, partial [Pirellula sp.]
AVSLALGLIAIPVAEIAFANRIHPKMAIICVIAGCMILWSVMPRFDRFVAPGPKLSEKDQPELFSQIRSIADATQQSMPVEVYAVPEMNAWVANRGGVMGFGSRRIMGLGVPLMQVLSNQQFRGVLAHEFGHYHAGDTKLGPWIYVTRSAIIRTVVNLLQNGSSILSKPFEWYLKLFLWITQKVSRTQEFTADALAAQTVGPEAMSSALKAVHSNAMAFQAYWEREYVPILAKGYRAPLSSGFQAFYSSPTIQSALDKELNEELKSGKATLYDSHPALKDRIAAISSLIGPKLPLHDPPFINCIRDLDGLEVKMIEHLASVVKEDIPKRIDWENVTEKVWLPHWEATLSQIAKKIPGLKLWQAVEMIGSQENIKQLISEELSKQVTDFEGRQQIACSIVPMSLLVSLAKSGWHIEAPVGRPVIAEKDGLRIEPFDTFGELAERKLSTDAVNDKLEAAGIDEVVLYPM